MWSVWLADRAINCDRNPFSTEAITLQMHRSFSYSQRRARQTHCANPPQTNLQASDILNKSSRHSLLLRARDYKVSLGAVPVWGQVGRGPAHPGPVGAAPAHGGGGSRQPLRSLLTQIILWPCDFYTDKQNSDMWKDEWVIKFKPTKW